MNKHTPSAVPAGADLRLRLALFIGLLLLVGLSQMYVIWEMVREWSANPDAGHGFFVLPLALYLAWQRRDDLRQSVRPASWLGVTPIFAALGLRFAGTWYGMPYLDRLAVIVLIWSAVWTLFGWPAAKRSLTPILFLILALPLPGRFQTLLAGPLQEFATRATEYLLVASGIQLTRAGNVLIVQDYQIAVAEACNGLRMLLAYAMICIFFALAFSRAWWERLLMVLAIVPVALAANVLRIYATALMVLFVSEEAAGMFFHDVAGYVLMPLAVVMLLVWQWVIRKTYAVDEVATQAAQLDAVSTVALGGKAAR
jgi:exosortase